MHGRCECREKLLCHHQQVIQACLLTYVACQLQKCSQIQELKDEVQAQTDRIMSSVPARAQAPRTSREGPRAAQDGAGLPGAIAGRQHLHLSVTSTQHKYDHQRRVHMSASACDQFPAAGQQAIAAAIAAARSSGSTSVRGHTIPAPQYISTPSRPNLQKPNKNVVPNPNAALQGALFGTPRSASLTSSRQGVSAPGVGPGDMLTRSGVQSPRRSMQQQGGAAASSRADDDDLFR